MSSKYEYANETIDLIRSVGLSRGLGRHCRWSRARRRRCRRKENADQKANNQTARTNVLHLCDNLCHVLRTAANHFTQPVAIMMLGYLYLVGSERMAITVNYAKAEEVSSFGACVRTCVRPRSRVSCEYGVVWRYLDVARPRSRGNFRFFKSFLFVLRLAFPASTPYIVRIPAKSWYGIRIRRNVMGWGGMGWDGIRVIFRGNRRNSPEVF